MFKIILLLLTGLLVSFYMFPIGLTVLPSNINSKMILAVFGLFLFLFNWIREKQLKLPIPLLGTIIIAVLFSLICFIAIDYNGTSDFTYAIYFVSFFVWLFASYAVCYSIKGTHGYISFELLVSYLALVCCVQCVFAVLIYNIPVLQIFVDTYIDQGQEFLLEVNRLYGIGASLDNAGVRFSVVLLAIMAVVVHSKMVRDSWSWLLLLLVSFIIIGVIGNMISRTTTIGLALSLIYFLIFSNVFKLKIQLKDLRLYFKLLLLLSIAIVIVVYYYKYNAVFNSQIRFAFEGFFNWLEVGEWRTDSTDKLNANMWIWPNDTKTWIIGTGLFADWIYNTDVGYCRIILYSGLIGFSTFSLFFVYNAVVFIKALPKYRSLFLGFLMLTFIIWIKVSTDLFFIYALFYSYLMLEDQIEKHTEYENSLLHPGNV